MVIKPWFTIWFNHTQKTMVYLPWFTMVVFLVGQGQGLGLQGQGQGQGLGPQGQGQGQGHDQLSSRRLEAKAMASRTPSLQKQFTLLVFILTKSDVDQF